MTAGTSAVLMVIGGGSAAVAALADDEPRTVTATGENRAVAAPGAPLQEPPGTTASPPAARSKLGGLTGPELAAQPVGDRMYRRTSEKADRTATRPPRAAATTTPPPDPAAARRLPVVTSRTVVETRAIPYRTRLVRDPDLPRGRKQVQAEGAEGEETLRWLVTYTDGRQTDRRLVDATVTRQPQERVVAFGTRRGRGDGTCRPGSDRCSPNARIAACPATGAEDGQVQVSDEDLSLPTVADLDEVALEPDAVCG